MLATAVFGDRAVVRGGVLGEAVTAGTVAAGYEEEGVGGSGMERGFERSGAGETQKPPELLQSQI